MIKDLSFGFANSRVQYSDRRAAYVVIRRGDEVAMVNSERNHFLPGGGSLPGEAPEDTVIREVREELGQEVSLLQSLGEATQYFYSATDDRHYKMLAVFFVGEFRNGLCAGKGEHRLDWLRIEKVEQSCFHECHAWAVRRACGSLAQLELSRLEEVRLNEGD